MSEMKFKAYVVEHRKGRPDKNGFKFFIKLRSADPSSVVIQDIDEEAECEVTVRLTGEGLTE